ncbi:putative transport protein HsrA [Pigmentiphaga humi]|uniref:Putative transport protein HsrA n=1 Tax=Pigmentiphaga humi TaxID=2478468 RepID=A0A3P4B786_9BURK|nr:MFS transporter [Pigmentiphaga humi]VCU71922.1 putative transport protein HsrA [Pigmentiphaga humi]
MPPTAAAVGAPPSERLSPQTRRTAWIVSSIFFVEQLDATSVASALPAMAADLNTDAVTLSATITAYLLGLTILIPLSGRLAERYGDKQVFAGAIWLFLASSIACGLAPNATFLIALRFIQGMAGALMAPVGRLIVLRAAAKHEIVEAMALVILLAMIAPMVGPFLGGLLTTYVGWRWIFWINGPLCLAALWLVWRFLPATGGRKDGAFDLRGTALSGLGFAGLTWGLIALADAHAQTGPAVAALVAGLLLLGAYVRHARRTAEPVLALDLLKLRSFRDAMAGGSVFRIAVGGVPFLLPVTLQQRDGYSPLEAGLVVLIPAVGGFAMKFFSGKILRRAGYRTGLFLHGLLAAACLAAAGLVPPRDLLPFYAALLLGFGWARSLQMNAYGTLAYADVARPRLAAATSFFLAVQNLTVAVGVAAAALLLKSGAAIDGAGTAFYSWAHLALAAIALASAIMTLSMPASAGSALLQSKRPS